MQLAQPGALPQQSPSKMFRSADGKMRVDTGNTSVITDPAAQKALVLDHLKKEAHMVPIPQAPQMPQMPAMPGGIPKEMPKPADVEDLGKGFIEGHEVEGKKFTFNPPKPPEMPKPPELPKVAIPGMPAPPQAPQLPQAPPPPQMPTVAEVWTSTKTKMPVLTKITGPFGQQVCHCKPGPETEPHPAVFQVPPDYKLT